MFYSSYGSFIHKLLEQYYLGFIAKGDLVHEFLTGYTTQVLGELPSESIGEKYISCGVNYFNGFTPLDMEIVGIEKKISFDLEGIPFVGIIDMICKNGDDFLIIDHKSRDIKPRTNNSKPTKKDEELSNMLRQLYIYSAAVKHEYGKFPTKLCFNCFRTGVFIEEPFMIEEYEKSIDWVINTINKIKKADTFVPHKEYFSCKYICGVHDECCYYKE